MSFDRFGFWFWGLTRNKDVVTAFFPTEFMGFLVPCRKKSCLTSEFSYNEWHESVELISVLYWHVRYSKVVVKFSFANRNGFYCFEWLKLQSKSSNFSEKNEISQIDRAKNFNGSSSGWTTSYLAVIPHKSTKTYQTSYIEYSIYFIFPKSIWNISLDLFLVSRIDGIPDW